MKFNFFLSVFFMLFLSACEMGHDQEGPYKSYLLLKNPRGEIVRFYLGGYDTLSGCLGVAKYEAEEARSGMTFWTNADYTYGGVRQDGWIKNEIVGAFCNKNNEHTNGTTTEP